MRSLLSTFALTIFLFSGQTFAQTTNADTVTSLSGAEVPSGSSVNIDVHGICKNVSYSGEGGIFIPTKTAVEFNSFLSANPTPAGVTVSDCAVSVTCYQDSDGDGYGYASASQTFSGSCGAGYVSNNTDCNDAAYSTTNTCASYTTFTCNSGSWAIGGSCASSDPECSTTLTILNGNSICCASSPTATCDGGGGGCFIAGAYVTTYDRRLEKIEDIKVGDKLLTVEGKFNEVLKLLRLPYKGQIYGLNGEKPFFTPNHPIKTVEGWKSLRPDLTKKEIPELEVEKLKVGDIVIKDTGLEAIMYMTNGYVEETVYNFTLDGDHEYLVNDLAVHNKLDCSCLGGAGTAGWSSSGGQGSGSGVFQANGACAGGQDEWCGSGAPSPKTCYTDSDGDGFGTGLGSTYSASCPSGMVTNDTDCDDTTYSSTNTCATAACDTATADYCCTEAQQCCKPTFSTPDGFLCEAGDPMVNGTAMGSSTYAYYESQCTYGYRVAGGVCETLGAGGGGSGLADGTICVNEALAPDTTNGKPSCADCENAPTNIQGMFDCDNERYKACGNGYPASCSAHGSLFCNGSCADL